VDVALLVARLVLFVVFAWAGLSKLADLNGTRQSLIEFSIPRALTQPFSILLPSVELAIAGSLLFAATRWWGAWAALALLVLFTIGISFALIKGRRPSCHCFGRFSAGPIGWPAFVRNSGLIVLASLIIRQRGGIPGRISETAFLPDVGTTIQLGMLCVLGAEAWLLLRLFNQYDLFAPQLAALPVAPKPGLITDLSFESHAPEFRLPGIHGELTALTQLRAFGKPVVLVFVDAGCGSCLEMLPAVGRWQRDFINKLTLAIVSSGSPETTRAKSVEHGLTTVLQQVDREVARIYRVTRAPSAIVIRPNGTFGSSLVVGAPGIESLVAQIATTSTG